MDKYSFQYSISFWRYLQVALTAVAFLWMGSAAFAQQKDMIIRISEIEIHPQHLEEYKAILKYEAEASVRLETGVVAIFPMYQKDNPTQVRILEMYEDQKAYQSHLKTEHFQKYKTTTLHMVKSLKLMDMEAIDLKAASGIFRKLKEMH
ncbi:putative quinol monooxygenase [Sphingobacterium spiritivorum]|uniref:putative quinol monooxygenase n=1 Tax=Sphingobacterium spiritivorum TaxID=258 RepID=UPI003DA509F6